MDTEETLDDLDVTDVFKRCLQSHEVPEDQQPALLSAYQEIIVSLNEADPMASRRTGMRILGVRFKNLNSLTGEWHVDFTHPDYSSDGIFAITGPTGAGKTTIMDAVCLGLYGRTPRLDKVTKSSNEIMSRQTGECFAEVTFETQKGRYRCHWSQHRARKKPDGELQQAKHEDSRCRIRAGAGIKDNPGRWIHREKATGMNFERFTRSMLLAQGGFAAFLQAPPNERAPILEQITGTEIYSQISMKVHQRRGKSTANLKYCRPN